MFTWMFWRSAVERAVKSFAQSLAACLGASGAGLWEVEWTTVLAVAGMTTLLSLLSSVASAPVGADHHSPSLLPAPGGPAGPAGPAAAPAGAVPQQRAPEHLQPAAG
ncbi:holin [Nocardioides sp. HDW12B]|uniref:holin n=1 Tax=Nocardioides sp. HDW12B TaxID=2714939 RepID=UPI001F0F1397|nr:holin [Nocardioides sp. HDW12B]